MWVLRHWWQLTARLDAVVLAKNIDLEQWVLESTTVSGAMASAASRIPPSHVSEMPFSVAEFAILHSQ